MEKCAATIIGLTLLSCVALLLVFIFNGISSSPNNGVFNNSIGNLSDKYALDITPAGYTFSIWGIIYLWQAAWMTYAIINIFRKNAKGRVILNPVLLPVKFHIFWILSCVFNISWLFAWDDENLLASFIVLLAFTLSGYAAVTFQSFATVDNEDWMKKEAKADLICTYVLIQNGTDLMYSWTTVATLLNLGIFVTYDSILPVNMSRTAASTMSLCILGVIIVGWSIAENTVFFKFFRYVYAWYGVLIWASIGILVKNFDPSNVNTILTIVLLCVAFICLCIKIAVYFIRVKNVQVKEKQLASSN